MKRLLHIALKGYLWGAGGLLAATLVMGAVGLATGKISTSGLAAASRTLVAEAKPGGAAPSEAQAVEKRADVEVQGAGKEVGAVDSAASPDNTPRAIPSEVLQEIELAGLGLKQWEERLSLLGHDLKDRSAKDGERLQGIQEQEAAWTAVRKSVVPLLNQLLDGQLLDGQLLDGQRLDGVGEWRPLTEDDFASRVLGPAKASQPGATSEPAALEGSSGATIPQLLDRLRAREAALAQSEVHLRNLSPEVLASVIAAGLKPGAASAGDGTVRPRASGGGAILGEQEIGRLVRSLEPARLAKVIKVLKDEDPRNAAEVVALIMKSAPAKADPASGPSDAKSRASSGERSLVSGGERKDGQP